MSLKYEVKLSYHYFSKYISHKRHGLYHNIASPSLMYDNGSASWCQYGKNHREDGPALDTPKRMKQYYRFDIKYFLRGVEYGYIRYWVRYFYNKLKTCL